MRQFITISFLILAVYSDAQNSITKYYDTKWVPCEKDKAVYYADFTKEGDIYKCTSYWKDKNILRGKSTFPDTLMSYPINEQVLYFKNGNIEDSGRYNNTGQTIERIIYYANGQLGLRYSKTPGQEKENIEAYEEDGKKIKNYIYEKEAEFKGGSKSWFSYISKNAGTFFTNEKTIQTAEVRVQFVVNTQGLTSQVKIVKSSGIAEVDNDAKRLITQSPQWNNAIQYNRPVIAYRVAPITYHLTPRGK